jgi:hypothetical protein
MGPEDGITSSHGCLQRRVVEAVSLSEMTACLPVFVRSQVPTALRHDIVGKTALPESHPLLRRSATLDPVFTSLGRVTVICYIQREVAAPAWRIRSPQYPNSAVTPPVTGVYFASRSESRRAVVEVS